MAGRDFLFGVSLFTCILVGIAMSPFMRFTPTVVISYPTIMDIDVGEEVFLDGKKVGEISDIHIFNEYSDAHVVLDSNLSEAVSIDATSVTLVKKDGVLHIKYFSVGE